MATPWWRQDSWPFRDQPLVTVGLLLLTLTYLFVEAAFNFRLLYLLGNLDIKNISADIVTEIEVSGRLIASTAVALALFGIYCVRAKRGRSPLPIDLFYRLQGRPVPSVPWGPVNYVIAGAILTLAWWGVFHWQKYVVEEVARISTPAERRKDFYAARVTQAATVCAWDMRRKGDALFCEPDSGTVLNLDVHELAHPAWQLGDGYAFSAIFPKVIQGYARSAGVTVDNVEGDTLRWLQGAMSEWKPGQSYEQIFVPMLDCARYLYDTGKVPDKPFDTTRCLRDELKIEVIVEKIAKRFDVKAKDIAKQLEPCIEPTKGMPKLYADFQFARCTYRKLLEAVKLASEVLADGYVKMVRGSASSLVLSSPARLAAASREDLRAWLNEHVGQHEGLAALTQRDAVRIGAEEALPACPADFTPPPAPAVGGSSPAPADPATAPPAVATARPATPNGIAAVFGPILQRAGLVPEFAATLEQSLQNDYCMTVLARLPANMAESPRALEAALAPGVYAQLNEQVHAGLLQQQKAFEEMLVKQKLPPGDILAVPPNWKIQPAETMKARWATRIRAALDRSVLEELHGQFGAQPSMAPMLVRLDRITNFGGFLAEPAVNERLRKLLTEASDLGFECLGMPDLRGTINVRQPLVENYESQWARNFHNPLLDSVTRHLFLRHLSGSNQDFDLTADYKPGRCYRAGIVAHHRTYVPAFALFVSSLGLLYHTFKAMLYLLRLFRLHSAARMAIAGLLVLNLAVIPMSFGSPVLQLPSVRVYLSGYELEEGRLARLQVQWTVNSQLYFHRLSEPIYRLWYRLTGIDFVSEPGDLLMSAPARPVPANQRQACERIERSVGDIKPIEMNRRLIELISSNSNLCQPPEPGR